MIEASIIIPEWEVQEFYRNEGQDFKIIAISRDMKRGRYFFHIRISEEQMTFLKLKYGADKVWNR
jgi:hypothetical protein